MALFLNLLIVTCATSGATHADEPRPLSKFIEPIRARWHARKLADVGYRQQMLQALKGHRVQGLWRAGFELEQTLPASGKIRLHEDDKPVEVVDRGQAVLMRFTSKGGTLHIGSPESCSLGCCMYPGDRRKSSPVIVVRACFDQAGMVTDLDVDTQMDSWAERQVNGVPEPNEEDKEERAKTQVTKLLQAARKRGWCTQTPDKHELTEPDDSLAESCYFSLDDSDPAQRAARHALGLKMWDTGQWSEHPHRVLSKPSEHYGRFLSTYWFKQPGADNLVALLRLAQSWSVGPVPKSLDGTSAEFAQAMQRALIGRPELTVWKQAWALARGEADPATSSVKVVQGKSRTATLASWATVSNRYGQKGDTPVVCYGDCCLIRPAQYNRPYLTELCFHVDGKVRSARVDDGSASSGVYLTHWLLPQVQLAAQRSHWNSALRPDACLPAAVDPDDAAAVLYCARRMDPGLTDYATKQAQIWAHLDELVATEVNEDLGPRDYYEGYWTSRAKNPADRLVREASLHPLEKLSPDGAWLWPGDVQRQRRSKATTTTELPRRLKIPEPTSCGDGCCDYNFPRTCRTCLVSDSPPLRFLARACFDASGATTDLYFDSQDCGESDERDSDFDEP